MSNCFENNLLDCKMPKCETVWNDLLENNFDFTVIKSRSSHKMESYILWEDWNIKYFQNCDFEENILPS